MKAKYYYLSFVYLLILGCNNQHTDQPASSNSSTEISNRPATSDKQSPVSETNNTAEINHKYSYVTYAGGAYIAGMLEIYNGGYTQAVTSNGFTASGRGNWSLDGDNISLDKTSGIAYNGIAKLVTLPSGEKAVVLSNGITYIEDDNGTYIKNLTVTPKYGSEKSSTTSDQSNTSEEKTSNDLTYTGTASDPQSGITQEYTLTIKSDFRSASIGGGPFTTIEDQRDGSYMWLDGTIIGMSFRPTKNSCLVYGSDGSYFCTLYRR